MLSEVLVLYEDVLAEKFREYGRKKGGTKRNGTRNIPIAPWFLLLSAGCAIGIGNVWKFPYMVGNNGGGIFVLFYLLFLAIMGVPILSMELAIGRGSKKSTVRAYGELEKKGQKWHIHGYVALIGNYLLMMFYTVVAGWMLYYFYSFLIGKFSGLTGDAVTGKFNEMLSSPSILVITMLIITIAGFLICSVGLQNGVERVTKVMMIVLMVIMIFLAVYSFTMPGAKEGLKFYLVPDMQQIEQVGLFHIITNAMSQAFFTLSLGIGAMLIFGSYLNGGKSLLGEAVSIAALDTFVAITAGLIIFPACFSYNVQPDSRPEADLYDAAAHFHLDEGRTDFRKLLLPVPVLCGAVYHHRCI